MSDTPKGSIELAREICEEVAGELPDDEQYGSVDVAKILSRSYRKLEHENAKLREALEACVKAAHDDKVEDFSAVSNAADQARAALGRRDG